MMLSEYTDIFLRPGEWYFGGERTRIRTTLGSCVAITLWHPTHKTGGMCHYMLPGIGRFPEELNGRYADDAVRLLLADIQQRGHNAVEYEAKAFGGGNMFGPTLPDTSVADRNVDAARQLLRHYGLNVHASHLGGSGYRQLIFNLQDGHVWLRQGGASQTGPRGVA
ncbi:MAG: chemotaxis protein CheD [Natronospirillum sp.]